MTVKRWQDTVVGHVEQLPGRPAPVPLRTIDDVHTLKALSDPTRLAILQVLMSGAHLGPRVMSVKELATELGTSQTKLYRHVKQLQACGLIEVAETRLVSGIIEQRYRTAQIDLTIDRNLLTNADPDDQAATIAAFFDTTRDELVAGFRSGQLRPSPEPPGREPSPHEHRLPTLLAVWQKTISPTAAKAFQDRLDALLDEISQAEHDDHGIPVLVLATMYSPPDTQRPSGPNPTPTPPGPKKAPRRKR